MDASSQEPQPAATPAPSRRALRSGAGVSALGGLGAVVGFFLPWFVFLVAVQTGCRAQFIQVQIYNFYGAALAVGNSGSMLIVPALMTMIFGVVIIILAALSLRRPGLIRIRILLALSLIGLVMLCVVGVAMVRDPVKPTGAFLYIKFLGFAPGFWVTAGGLALALIGGATLHAAARASPQRRPIGEIALAALGVVALLSSTTAAMTLRQAPYPTLTCAQWGNLPFAGGSLVYFTTPDDVYARDATSGQVRWRCQNPLGGVVTGTAPALVAGVLYVAARDGYVYAIRADTAKILWHTDVGGRGVDTTAQPHVAPIVADGLVFGVNGAGQIYVLRASDGVRAWSIDAARPAVWSGSTPLLADGALLYPAYTRTGLAMTALDERTGQRRWQSPDNCEVFPGGSVPLLSDQSAIYVEETSAQTGEVDLVSRAVADGVTRWRYPVSTPGSLPVTSVFTVADGVVYLELRQERAPTVVALRADDGVVMWSAPAPDVVSSQNTPEQPMIPLVGQAPQVTPTLAPPSTPSSLPTPQSPTPKATQEPLMTPTLAPPPMTTQRVQAQVTLAADRSGVYVAVSAVPGGGLTTIYRFNARHGAVVWRRTFAHRTTAASQTMFGTPTLRLTGDSVYLLDPSGVVAGFDARTGASRWQLSSGPLPSSWSPVPGAIAGGAASVSGSTSGPLYVATSSLYAISPLDGAVRWQFTPDIPTTPYALRLHPLTPVISPPTPAP